MGEEGSEAKVLFRLVQLWFKYVFIFDRYLVFQFFGKAFGMRGNEREGVYSVQLGTDGFSIVQEYRFLKFRVL